MKIFYIKYKILYIILIFMIILSLFIYLYFRNQSIHTFNNSNIYYEGNSNKNAVSFACNVDWGEELISDMLKIFDDNNIKITFFVTGKWAEKNPEMLREMYKNGHEIGSHGYMHRNYGDLSYTLNLEEIKKADTIIAKIIGKKPKLFAPPSGSFNDSTIQAAKEENHNVIMWTVDTIDWRKDSTKDIIIDRVISKTNRNSIILMHPKEETIKALPIIIEKLKDKGFSIEKISDILN